MNIKPRRLLTAQVVLLVLSVLFFSSGAFADDSAVCRDLFRGIEKEVLPNGLTIITQVNGGPPIVSINFFVNTGSINEDDKITGISHFCEHMFYRGTAELNNIEMKSEIENLGGSFNAETSKDYTRFYVNVPSEYGLKALKIYSDSLKNASYLAENVEKERKVILEEYNLMLENPMALLHDNLYAMAFNKHPYKRSPIGTLNSLKNLTRDDLLQYKTRWYTPEHIVVVLTGNFDRKKYVQFVREQFESLPGGTPGISTTFPPEPIEKITEKIEERPFSSENAYFAMGFVSPAMKDQDDVAAMDLLIFMLGQGKDGILNRELNIKQKLTYKISGDFQTSKDSGLITFSGKVSPDKLKTIRESLLALLENIKLGNISDTDMERARNMLTKVYIYGMETNEGKAQNFGFYELLSGMDFARQYVDRIKSLKKEDLVRVANKYFGQNYVLYALKPAKDE